MHIKWTRHEMTLVSALAKLKRNLIPSSFFPPSHCLPLFFVAYFFTIFLKLPVSRTITFSLISPRRLELNKFSSICNNGDETPFYARAHSPAARRYSYINFRSLGTSTPNGSTFYYLTRGRDYLSLPCRPRNEMLSHRKFRNEFSRL